VWTNLYEQYTVVQKPGGYAIGERKETVGVQHYTHRELKGFTSYTFDETTGKFAAAGEYKTFKVYTESGDDYTVYTYFNTYLMGTRAVSVEDYIQYYNITVYRKEKPTVTGPGELVRRFAAEAGEWPMDGMRDGYWYRCVREFAHQFLLYAQKDGLRREVRSACVRVPEGLRELFCGAEARTEK